LKAFLEDCTEKGRRDIREIRRYFHSIGIAITIYSEDEFFSHGDRGKYFQGIGTKLLSNSLVFLDPDNGMEIKHSNRQHVMFGELKEQYDRMNNNSVLMVYQHSPRAKRYEYIQERSGKLHNITGGHPSYISDNEIIFFFMTKKSAQGRRLSRALENYCKKYNRLETGNVGHMQWAPGSLEDKILFKYWQENGGTVYLEVPIGNSGRRGGWPPGSNVRRIDGVRIPSSSTGQKQFIASAGSKEIDLYEIFRDKEVELIEVKKELNRVVFGQVVAGVEMFNRQYKPKKVIPIVLYREGDPAMEWVCHRNGVQAIGYGSV
jgi:hypothetical protein